jgi:hypothetical protein
MKSIIGIFVIAFAFVIVTSQPTKAEPITLTVMAISGIAAVASMAAADITVHTHFNQKEEAARNTESRLEANDRKEKIETAASITADGSEAAMAPNFLASGLSR